MVQDIRPNKPRRAAADSLLQQQLRFGFEANAILSLVIPGPIEATQIELGVSVVVSQLRE